MEVDTATSVTQTPVKHPLPEVEMFCYLLVLIYLIDQKKYNEVKIHTITLNHTLFFPLFIMESLKLLNPTLVCNSVNVPL